jgi:hypothetical protein
MTFNGRRPRDRRFCCSHCTSRVFSFALCIVFAVLFIRLCIPSRSIIAVVNPLCTSITRVPRINVKRVMKYF